MIRGAPDTPYFDGLFIFDIRLKPTYPNEPPAVFYSEKLNPNLYQEGTVCVSLLGTWNGKDSEMWNPGSNLLQVIVSIQGLILNSEPYYNEAGYEVRRVNPDYAEKSRCYNEMALVRNLENLCNIIATRASPFMKEIDEHLLINVPKLDYTPYATLGLRLRGYAGLGQSSLAQRRMPGVAQRGFPAQPISIGCARSLERQLDKLKSLLNERQNNSN
uniref:UBC core domain-containing protein n=1 Tax=Romanomermis culicivorax TaxID=13658 RepID=A0A915ITN3_ROMCU